MRPGTRCTSRASAAAYQRTMLEGGASLGVHESQSRLWENIVGRSLPVLGTLLPETAAAVSRRSSARVTLDAFYRAINRVERSLIRVEADEATYNLHVMLRVELEIALVEGRLAVEGSRGGLEQPDARVSRRHAAELPRRACCRTSTGPRA